LAEYHKLFYKTFVPPSNECKCSDDPFTLEDEDEIKAWVKEAGYGFMNTVINLRKELDDKNRDTMYFDYEMKIVSELRSVREDQPSGAVTQIPDASSRFRAEIQYIKDDGKCTVKDASRDEMRQADAFHRKVLKQNGSSLERSNNGNPASDEQVVEETAPEPNAGGDDDVDAYDEDETVYTSLALQRVVMFVLIFGMGNFLFSCMRKSVVKEPSCCF